ncbi:hypothetical protein [Marinicella rhabdoformis]|uniref:hypothetical protein n=1 Tax=Marinicella rhabdoformis TaxID=2580566 RepID=UPI0012AED0EF|nr:hypothetical protein [Marinicella rhabdoformis]
MIKKGLLILLLLLVFGANAGLFGDKVVKIESFDGTQHGLVVLQISTNSNYQRGLSNWDFVTVKNVSSGKSFRLLPVNAARKYASVVFGGYLKPGRYVVEDVYEDTEYAGCVIFHETHAVKANHNEVAFEVVLNQITDVGTVLLFPQHHGINNYSVVKSFSMVQVQDDGLDLAALLLNKYKSIFSSVALYQPEVDKSGSIQPPELMSGLPFKYFYQQNSEERIMLHRHGLISRKVGAGQWQQFNTGRVQQYNAIAKVANGYVIGGEYGAVLFSEDLMSWRSLDLLPIEASVMNIQVTDEVIQLSVHMPGRRGYTYELSSNFSNLREVASHKLENINYRVDAYNQHEDVIQSNGYVVKKSLGFNKTSIQMTSGSKDKKVYSGKPRDFFVSGFNYTRDVFVVDENNMFLISSPIKRYKKGSYRLKSFKKPYQLYLYYGSINEALPNDEANKVSSIPQRCSTFVPEISTASQIYLSCINGDLQVSKDQGKTWYTDYQTGINQLQ